MSETPGLPSALGIEAVQWLVQGESVTVRVQGRWRRRRPGSGGQALLVLEALGQRHRFPAMPEPPSVIGAAPGTWQLSFSVPALLAPPHAERAWLQLGAVGVPLPLPIGLEADPVEVPGDAEPAVTVRRADADDALDSARRRTAEAEQIAERLAASVSELEEALEAARIEPTRLTAALAELDRARRVAEQRAHAERQRRHELEQELAEREREAGEEHAEELSAYRHRVRELEQEVRQLGRAVDEAEHAAAAALAAREQAVAQAIGRTVAEGVSAELEALEQSVPAPVGRAVAAPLAHDTALIIRERAAMLNGGPAVRDDHTLSALRIELESRGQTEAALRAEIAELKGRLAIDPTPAAAIESALAELRAELDRLGQTIEREASLRAAAESKVAELEAELHRQLERSARASQGIDKLREDLARLGVPTGVLAPAEAVSPPAEAPAPPVALPPRPPLPPPPPLAPPPSREAPPSTVDPERFSAALSRLREASPIEEAPAEPETPAVDSEPDAPVAEAEAEAEPEPEPDAEARPDAEDELEFEPEPPAHPISPDWLPRAFSTLADRDLTSAGELVVALLPAQHLTHPDALAYDLVLDRGTCVQVTVAGAATEVQARPRPRAKGEVAFKVTGDARRIARLVRSGSLRRRLPGRRIARISGARAQAAALTGLVRTPASLGELVSAGVALVPQLAFQLVAAMIDPSWNAGESFVVAHRRTDGQGACAYLWVRDRARALAGAATPQAPVGLTIHCPDADVLPLLAKIHRADMASPELDGEGRLLELLQAWIERAQRA